MKSSFIEFEQISTLIYFAYFLIIVSLISLLENILIEIASEKNVTYYMKQLTHVSGWWWEDLYSWTLEALFKKSYTEVYKNWNSQIEILLTSKSELDWYNNRKRFWSN